nr:RNA-directed DNA polymerase, eukaryota, reverse transcriptase zinc-binding domain protein [Tanacetum cinerariifolium]
MVWSRVDDESNDEKDINEDQMNENDSIIADEIVGGEWEAKSLGNGNGFLIFNIVLQAANYAGMESFGFESYDYNNSGSERRILWSEFEQQKYIVGNCTWLILEDFNVTIDISEHSAGGSYRTLDMQELKDTMNSIEMEDICSNGFHFTWTTSLKNPKCNTLKKLDRMLVNEEFMQNFPKAFGVFLPYIILDHSPVVLIIKDGAPKKKKSFSPHDESIKKIVVDTLNDYTEVVNDELGLLKQKAKVNWMKTGDKNTAFFHGQYVKHFEEFLRSAKPMVPLNTNIFKNTLSLEEVKDMVREFSDNEIKEALFDIDGNKASGPDGYSYEFLKKSWEVIREEFYLAMKEFFRSGKLLGEINATLIALIPKAIFFISGLRIQAVDTLGDAGRKVQQEFGAMVASEAVHAIEAAALTTKKVVR